MVLGIYLITIVQKWGLHIFTILTVICSKSQGLAIVDELANF